MGIYKLGTPTDRNLNPDSQAGKGSAIIPSGTTAQRSSIAKSGQLRYNTTLSRLEMYDGTTWQDMAFDLSYEANVLVVAGGGGTAYDNGGGGGAGGYRDVTVTVESGNSYPISIGGGGSAGPPSIQGTNGSPSYFSSTTSTGGGTGAGDGVAWARPGGSGGGGGRAPAPAGSGNAGSYSPPEGNPGGGEVPNDPIGYGGSGGGGANAAGQASPYGPAAGAGGAGKQWPINSSYYAGGGGGGSTQGGSDPRPGGTGGIGGGGHGGNDNAGSPGGQNGTANTGGGGGGGGQGGPGFNGGSGVVIVAYPTSSAPATAGGGSLSISGSYTLHTFTSPGTFTA